MDKRRWLWVGTLMLAVGLASSLAIKAYAQDKAAETKAADQAKPVSVEQALKAKQDAALQTPKVWADTMWTLIAGMLVFFMNLGFACVETGMCRAKNAVNILSKNFIVFAASAVAFWFIGWDLMFGDGNGFIGTAGHFFASGQDWGPLLTADLEIKDAAGTVIGAHGDYDAINWTSVPMWTKFFFQLVFAGTAATIVSGAVAERIKYGSFILFTFFMGMFIYPVVGHWIWGGGWSALQGFRDFAGSTQVHSIGGWAALAGVIMLGARIGKYSADGKVNPIPGHNMALGLIGTFVLWFGWFGFNPGSTMGMDAVAIGEIAMTTNMAACAATLTATATAWIMMGKPDLGMTLNGCLAGLVAITAPCAFVTVGASVVIGAISGVLVVLAVMMFDRLKLDDPVGALSVHLVNGVFGTLCVGLFSEPERLAIRGVLPGSKGGLFYGGGMGQLMTQLWTVLATAGYVLAASFIFWTIVKVTIGMRVTKEEEIGGLDLGEHGMEAYPSFVMHQGK
jgi:ammonium transporter, Amt family